MLIGLAGHDGVGKSYAAKYLVSKLEGYKIYSFSEPLKRSACELFGLTNDQVYGSGRDVMDPRWGKTPRQILRLMGSEFAQDMICKDVFIKRAPFGAGACVIFDDVRYDNQAAYIRDNGGHIIHIASSEGPSKNSITHKSQFPVSKKLSDSDVVNYKTNGSFEKGLDHIISLGRLHHG